MVNYIALSKEVSFALRHAPWQYELELDEEGWVSIEQLINALHVDKKWKDITTDDLINMINYSDKKRHEVKGDKIRALYGHSTPIKITKKETEPPLILYHGTANRFLKSITEKGLLPQKRQYVHLSEDIETAIIVGKRYDNNPILLEIAAIEAWKSGVKFYLGNENVWLADKIPSDFISVSKK